MLRKCVLSLSLLGMAACQQQSPPDATVRELQPRADRVEAEARNRASDRSSSEPVSEGAQKMPPPETLVTFQSRTVKLIPTARAEEPMKQVADQWIFKMKGTNDDTTICVDDDAHCIKLRTLREQLYRLANDPLGIR